MPRPAAITALHAFGWIYLIGGLLAGVGLVVAALANSNTPSTQLAFTLVLAFGAAVSGIFMWAFLSTVAHIADTLIDIRDQRD